MNLTWERDEKTTNGERGSSTKKIPKNVLVAETNAAEGRARDWLGMNSDWDAEYIANAALEARRGWNVNDRQGEWKVRR